MKCWAICPLCNARISRMGVFSTKVKCRACGVMLRQNAKWDWIGCGIIAFLIVFLPLVIVFSLLFFCPYSVHASVLTLSVMVVVLSLVGFIVGFILFPYISKYEIDPKHDKSNSTGEEKE